MRATRNPVLQRAVSLILAEWGTIAFTCLSFLFLFGSLGLRGQAGIFPLGASIATSALGVAVLVAAYRSTGAGEPASEDAAEEIGWNARTYMAAGWFVFALLVTYYFGILVGSAVGTASYFLLIARVRIITALVTGCTFPALIWVVFDLILSRPVYGGMF